MSVTINGTSGVTTPGINNSEGYTGDGLTIAAGAPAGAMTLDASGNAGLGVTPSAWDSGYKSVENSAGSLSASSAAYQFLTFNGYVNGGSWKYRTSGTTALQYAQYSGQHVWNIAPSGTAGNPITFTQAMTLDASGNLLVGTTTYGSGPAAAKLVVRKTSISQGDNVIECGQAWTTNSYQITFFNPNGLVGSITSNGSSTAYNTSSDYRLKENVAPLTNALDKIASLKPCTFTWKADGSADRGFIAHELQEIIPQAVSGEKDAVDAEGNIMPQGVDYGKITPELVAAIQELKARIEQLEAK